MMTCGFQPEKTASEREREWQDKFLTENRNTRTYVSSDGQIKRDRAAKEEQERANRKARESTVRNQQALGTVACTQAIESIPQFASRWTNSLLESKWNQVAVVGDRLVFGGDRLEVQNPFGAWVRHSYICDFNVSTEEADAVLLPKGAITF